MTSDMTGPDALLEAFNDPDRMILILGHDTFYFDERYPLNDWKDMTVDNPRYAQIRKQFEALATASRESGVTVISKISAEKGNRSKLVRTPEDRLHKDRYTGPESAFECYVIGRKMADHYGVPFITDPQTPEELAIAAPFLDAIQVSAVQANLNKHLVAAVEGCYNSESKSFEKILFIKIPLEANEEAIANLVGRAQDASIVLQKRNGIEEGQTGFHQIPAIYCHRGRVIDTSGVARFVPESVVDTIRHHDGKVGLDVSHALPRGLDDSTRDAAIRGNLYRGLHYLPKVVFMEMRFNDSIVLVDGDRSCNFNSVDELTGFVKDIKERYDALRTTAAGVREQFGFYTAKPKEKSRKPRAHIALITDTLHGNDGHRFSKQDDTTIPDAGYSTRVYWEMLKVIKKETGAEIGLYTAKQLLEQPELLREFPSGPNLIGICVGNRSKEMQQAINRITLRGGNIVTDYRDGHLHHNPDSAVRQIQLYAINSAHGLVVNHANHYYTAENTGKPVLLLPDAVLDACTEVPAHGSLVNDSKQLHFIQACARRHLPEIYKQLTELNSNIQDILNNNLGPEARITYNIFSRPKEGDLGLASDKDYFQAIRDIQPADPRFKIAIDTFNADSYNHTVKTLHKKTVRGEVMAHNLVTYDTSLPYNHTAVGNVRQVNGWLNSCIVGPAPVFSDPQATGAGYIKNLSELITPLHERNPALSNMKAAATFLEQRSVKGNAAQLYDYLGNLKIK